MKTTVLCEYPVCMIERYVINRTIFLTCEWVWDSRILCDKAVYAFKRYANKRCCLCKVQSDVAQCKYTTFWYCRFGL